MMQKIYDVTYKGWLLNPKVKLIWATMLAGNLGKLMFDSWSFEHPDQWIVEKINTQSSVLVKKFNDMNDVFTPYVERLCHIYHPERKYLHMYEYFSDGVHLSTLGTKYMAELINSAANKNIEHGKMGCDQYVSKIFVNYSASL